MRERNVSKGHHFQQLVYKDTIHFMLPRVLPLSFISPAGETGMQLIFSGYTVF